MSTQRKTQYWSIFIYGGYETICSKHRTAKAAIRESKRCEGHGGNPHRIVKVVEIQPYLK